MRLGWLHAEDTRVRPGRACCCKGGQTLHMIAADCLLSAVCRGRRCRGRHTTRTSTICSMPRLAWLGTR